MERSFLANAEVGSLKGPGGYFFTGKEPEGGPQPIYCYTVDEKSGKRGPIGYVFTDSDTGEIVEKGTLSGNEEWCIHTPENARPDQWHTLFLIYEGQILHF